MSGALTYGWDCLKPCFGILDRDKDGDIDLDDLRVFTNETWPDFITKTRNALETIDQGAESLAKYIAVFKTLAQNDAQANKHLDQATRFLENFDKHIDKAQDLADAASDISLPTNAAEIHDNIQAASKINATMKEQAILLSGARNNQKSDNKTKNNKTKKNKNKKQDSQGINLESFEKFDDILQQVEARLVQLAEPAATSTTPGLSPA